MTRPVLDRNHPVHVMLRTCRDVPRLRQRIVYRAFRQVLARYIGQASFRVVHISIQRNHIHMIVEAQSKLRLSRGMQSFAINAARAINRACDRTGKVFQFRYKAKQIQTREYARNAIAYVVNNWRRHAEDRFGSNAARKAALDPYSSAISFQGWAHGHRFEVPRGYLPLPVSPPRTGLLQSAWQWRGLIDPWERPGTLA